jgi:putative membrane protein
MGIHTVYPDNITRKEGIGPGGVTVIILKTAEKEMALVSVDGNNVQPGFREEVISILKTQGFDDAEITTTDTHVVNAISLSSKGYPPVGRNKPEETLEHIVIAATKARETVRPVSTGLGFGKVENIRTFGERGFDTLTQDVAEAAGIAKRVGIRLGGLAFLALILISFLI